MATVPKETPREGAESVNLDQVKGMAGYCEHGSKFSNSMKCFF
jgi:hypothetical protein